MLHKFFQAVEAPKDAHEPNSKAAPSVLSVALVSLLLGCSSARDAASPDDPKTARAAPDVAGQWATSVFLSGNIVTMDDKRPTAQALAVLDGKILAIGSDDEILQFAGPTTQRHPLYGNTLMPGFIDPHSHMAGYAFFNDPEHWLDVSSINVLFKPPPHDSRCKHPTDPQHCFIPVRHHDDVLERIKNRLAQMRKNRLPDAPTKTLLAFNYDPSRLGHGSHCKSPTSLAFECQNFEDGTALKQLDALAQDIPIYVTSESGHISYVNTLALNALNICGVPGAVEPCYQPTTNSPQEIALAKLGQLNEDLSLYATGFFESELLKLEKKGHSGKLLKRAAEIYAQHGYTLVQEGAANMSLVALYEEQLHVNGPHTSAFPVAASIVAYDATSADFAKTIETAVAGRELFGSNPLLSVAGVKTFTDGSPQGFTADLKQPYKKWFFPFTDAQLFEQPYSGLPDVTAQTIAERLVASHKAGFPMVIHQIGDQGIENAVGALVATKATPPPQGKRDVVLHAALASPTQLAEVAKLGTAAVSIMSSNVYYFGLPECHQVLGPERARNIYPAKEALKQTGRVTLHSDSPVTPPYPLFEVWTAVTRKTQQPPWYPNYDPIKCPEVAVDDHNPPGDQRLTLLEAIRGFTVDAAWQYGMERERGSLEVGKFADLVVLSASPLSDEVQAEVDKLKTIRVLATVRYGTYFENPHGYELPIWPE